MKAPFSRAAVAGVAGLLMLVGAASPAAAHMRRQVGGFATVVGWLEEPAFAGFRNAVDFRVERPGGPGDGTPVTDAQLQVEVIFGGSDGTRRTDPMDLAPAFGSPGEYHAFLIPTEPGTYTFRIFGTIGGEEFDQTYTSGEQGPQEGDAGTYNDLRAPTDVQFPAQPPSNADLDQRLQAEATRLAAAADSADGAATTAMIIGIVALIVGAAALGASLLGRRRKGTA